jgi:nucleotide-binding universal stress UspA family protein
MASTGYGILVGYDGSSSSHQALSWAAREARARGVTLTLCHTWVPGSAGPPLAGGTEDVARESAERILATGVRTAFAPDVRKLLTEGSAARMLCEHSADADMVVVGSRGLGGLSGLMLGSVSLQVTALATVPVVVVRGHWRPVGEYQPGHIVVGADGSGGPDDALAFGGTEAALRGVPLTVVCALADAPGNLGMAQRIEEDVERSIIRWEKDHPDVQVHRQITLESPRSALLAAAQDAQLLVVGCRGRGGMEGMTLGSVTQALLWHAPCPLAVIHAH